MSGPYFLNVATVRVDKGDHSDVYTRGDELVDVPAGTMESLIRLGWALERDAFDELHPPPPPDQPVDEPGPVAVLNPGDDGPAWLDTPVADLGLSGQIQRVLEKNDLTTVGQILKYGAASGGLTKISGIGKASELEIKEALLAIQQSAQ